MPEDFMVPASGTIEYQYFQIPTNLTEDKWVQAIEFMPGAREVVHHVLVYAYVPPAPGAQQQAAPMPRPAGSPPHRYGRYKTPVWHRLRPVRTGRSRRGRACTDHLRAASRRN